MSSSSVSPDHETLGNLYLSRSRGSRNNDGDGMGNDALLTDTNWLTLSLLLCVQKQMRWWSAGHMVLWSVLKIDVQVRSFLTHMLGIAKSKSEWVWISCCSTIIFLEGMYHYQLSKWCLNETPYHPPTSRGHLMITEQLLLHINLIGIQYSPWGELKLWAENNMIAFWTDYHMQRSWDIIWSWLGGSVLEIDMVCQPYLLCDSFEMKGRMKKMTAMCRLKLLISTGNTENTWPTVYPPRCTATLPRLDLIEN